MLVADGALENMYSLAYSYLSETRREVVDEFTFAKQVINTGIRKKAKAVAI